MYCHLALKLLVLLAKGRNRLAFVVAEQVNSTRLTLSKRAEESGHFSNAVKLPTCYNAHVESVNILKVRGFVGGYNNITLMTGRLIERLGVGGRILISYDSLKHAIELLRRRHLGHRPTHLAQELNDYSRAPI